MKRSPAAAALVAFVCTAGVAAAQPRSKTPQDQAREEYQRGVVAYNLEHFDEAVAAFARAYELDPAPILLFNIAQARWKKGENDRAIFYYRRYLEADPAAANRSAVEARIQELERARKPVTTEPAAAAAPAVITPVPAPPIYVQESAPPPPPIYRRPWFWGTVTAAAAATVVTVLLLSAKSPPGPCKTDCKQGTITVPAP